LDEAVQANKRPRRKSGDPGSAADVEAEAEVESEEETDVDAEAETGGDTSRRITQRRTRAARDYRGMGDGDDDDDDDYDSAAAEEEEAEEEEEAVEMGRGKRKRRPTHLLESDDSEAEAGKRTAGKRAREGGGWLVPRCRACAGSHRKHTCGKAKVERRQLTLLLPPAEEGEAEGEAEGGGGGAEGVGGGAETARSCHPSLLCEPSDDGGGYLPAVTVSGAGRGARRRRDEKNGRPPVQPSASASASPLP